MRAAGDRPHAFSQFLALGPHGREPATHPGAGPNRESFTPAVRHIQAVVRGEEEPRLLAIDTSLGSAQALHDLARSAAAQTPTPAQLAAREPPHMVENEH